MTLATQNRTRFQELADFLRKCRARTSPKDVGLVPGRRQRLPGLRREQVAQLASISEAWYARLEQGSERGVSAQVLHAVADAIHMEPVEREYLLRLAGGPHRPPEASAETLAALDRLVGCIGSVPAFVVGPRWDILVWNQAASALYGGLEALPAERRNVLWLVFGTPDVAAMTDDWTAQARATVAQFRLSWAHSLEDPCYEALVAELCAQSELFGRWWADHDVRPALARQRTYRHPAVGCLQVEMHLFRVHDPAELWQVIVAPQPGTGTDARLRQLIARTCTALTTVLCGAGATATAMGV